jgi:hypothetical protein
VKTLLYFGGAIYQTNEAGGWWRWNVNQWENSSDPRAAAPSPSPAPGPSPAPPPSQGVPDIANMARHPGDMLEVGKFWIYDNRWGSRGLSEGGASHQYTQEVERALTPSSSGAIAFRIKWKWPEFDQSGAKVNDNPAYGEVKGYPCAIYGPPPGLQGPDQYPGWVVAVRAADGVTVPNPPAGAPTDVVREWQPKGGSVIRRVPSSCAPGHHLPKRLGMPDGSIVADLKWKKTTATGRGHLSFDIWLQETPDQVHGFPNTSITHEIMIPVGNWGTYGRHPNGRNPGWYSHDTTIDGVVYHVYFAGEGYSFMNGTLSGKYANEEKGGQRTGWKFIIFQHDGDDHPKGADGNIHLDFSKFFAHMQTRKAKDGKPFVRGTEYCTNVQLGVEMVYGNGDLTIYDFNVTGK